MKEVAADSVVPASACSIAEYGYRGTVMCEAVGLEVEWSAGRFEYFDISTDPAGAASRGGWWRES